MAECQLFKSRLKSSLESEEAVEVSIIFKDVMEGDGEQFKVHGVTETQGGVALVVRLKVEAGECLIESIAEFCQNTGSLRSHWRKRRPQ